MTTRPLSDSTPTSGELAHVAVAAARSKGATNVVALDVHQATTIADVFVICSASNRPQINAIVDEVSRNLAAVGVKARRESDKEDRWVLLDFMDIIVHVQHDEERAFYGLERLWRDCPILEIGPETSPEASPENSTNASTGINVENSTKSSTDTPVEAANKTRALHNQTPTTD